MKEAKFTLGSMIRSARENKGMTRTKLAEFTGISPNTLAKYEKAHEPGGKTPGLPKMVKLARVLEIDPRWIFQRIFDLERLREEGDGFSFNDHFATDIDFLNWKLQVKDAEALNDHLGGIGAEMHYLEKRLEKIEGYLTKNDPDQKDPGRSENSTSKPKAVGAASSSRKKKRTQP